jgi:hypothetical protein
MDTPRTAACWRSERARVQADARVRIERVRGHEGSAMPYLWSASLLSRTVTGTDADQKVSRLIDPELSATRREALDLPRGALVASSAGYSLHAATHIDAEARDALVEGCPQVSTLRLAPTDVGRDHRRSRDPPHPGTSRPAHRAAADRARARAAAAGLRMVTTRRRHPIAVAQELPRRFLLCPAGSHGSHRLRLLAPLRLRRRARPGAQSPADTANRHLPSPLGLIMRQLVQKSDRLVQNCRLGMPIRIRRGSRHLCARYGRRVTADRSASPGWGWHHRQNLFNIYAFVQANSAILRRFLALNGVYDD